MTWFEQGTHLAITQESVIRLCLFLGVFLVMALWERYLPRRQHKVQRQQRWPNNLALVALGTLVVRWVFPFSAVALAWQVQAKGWGLLNHAQLPWGIAVVLALLALDFAIYCQHRLFHAVPWLWRLHRVHHADIEFDVTTGIRFHPLEVLLSMGIKWGVIAVLGAPALAVLLFELLLNTSSLFNHGNVKISERVDRWLRWALVTPDMHRIHHSIRVEETNSNFGFNLPWWDRLLGTYRKSPQDGQTTMTIGLSDFRDPKELRLDRMLLQPLRSISQP